MLSELVVEGLGVIDRAELHLTDGSSALTGETGAGKTLLVAALGLLVGARSDKGLVRQGAAEARVDARFVLAPDHPVLASLEDLGVGSEAGEVVLSRVVDAGGKSKSRINGRPVTLGTLHDVGNALVEIAGQNEHHQLAHGSAQRQFLDAYAGEAATAMAVQTARAVEHLTALTGELEALQTSERDRARELDVLKFEIDEIGSVAPLPSEGDDLAREASRLEHADAIGAGISAALERLRGDGGVGEMIPGARSDLEGVVDKDPGLAPLVDRLDGVSVEVADITDELTRVTVPVDPAALARVRERIGILARLRRKYGSTEQDVLSYLERCKTRADELERAGDDEAGLIEAVQVAREAAAAAAEQLSKLRHEAAPRLAAEMERSMSALALPDATFKAGLQPRALYGGGIDDVVFEVAANSGEVPRPIAKVASGGELSRIALALRLLASTGTAPTMVFDEVDAGVGGEAARAVGEYLAKLGQRPATQVLVVTHLPQVAAFADHQYVVTKATVDGRSASEVTRVEGEARVEELSRMLAGLPESERAREHAQELLELAVREGHG